MIEQLTNIWKEYETKQLAKVFKAYMESIGAKKHVDYKEGKPNTYAIDGTTTNWNRVQLYYCKEPFKYCEEDLEITLRKRMGDYFIIERKGVRAFEVDYSGIRHYDVDLMKEILQEHAELFKMLGVEGACK